MINITSLTNITLKYDNHNPFRLFLKLYRFQTGERRQGGVCGGIGRQTRGLAKLKFKQVQDRY